jgi:hypothetical protein
MSSYRHTEPIRSGDLESAESSDRAQHQREGPRRRRSTGRRQAAAVAIGLTLASASVAMCGRHRALAEGRRRLPGRLRVRRPRAPCPRVAARVRAQDPRTRGPRLCRGRVQYQQDSHGQPAHPSQPDGCCVAHRIPNSRRSAVVRPRVTRECASASNVDGFSQSVHVSQSDTPVLSLPAVRMVRLSSANARSLIAPG